MPAGTYHFVLDCIVTAPVDVTFQLIWRRMSDDTVLSKWTQHFDPLASSYAAQAYEVDQQAMAIDFVDVDQLVVRYTANASSKADAWIPNGDGDKSMGRIPYLALP